MKTMSNKIILPMIVFLNFSIISSQDLQIDDLYMLVHEKDKIIDINNQLNANGDDNIVIPRITKSPQLMVVNNSSSVDSGKLEIPIDNSFIDNKSVIVPTSMINVATILASLKVVSNSAYVFALAHPVAMSMVFGSTLITGTIAYYIWKISSELQREIEQELATLQFD